MLTAEKLSLTARPRKKRLWRVRWSPGAGWAGSGGSDGAQVPGGLAHSFAVSTVGGGKSDAEHDRQVMP